MAKQYSEVFKRNCVQKLTDLKAKGIVRINKVEVKNVRELVKALDISNDSLYKWNKVYFATKSNDNDVSDDFFDSETKPKSEQEISSGEIFGIRYYSWFARNLGVKNYSRMVLVQLKLAIGNELIKQSGLVDMNKASKKLSQNAINYIKEHGEL
ncbi:DNA binding protein [Lokiarchaeota virus WyrdV1]|nr:DNA binding protein [Lokiarchaeota virus WyrdV1]